MGSITVTYNDFHASLQEENEGGRERQTEKDIFSSPPRLFVNFSCFLFRAMDGASLAYPKMRYIHQQS